MITVKMAGFTSGEPAPSSFIAALFPSKGNLYIALDSTGGAPAFTYGTYADVAQGVLQFTEAGNLDERSSFGADGTIVMVAPYSIFGGLNVGDVLAGFDVRARIGARSATSRDTAGPGDYIVRGVDICSALPPIEPPVVLPPAPVKDEGRFGTTALDWLILAPLFGFALRRRKR